MTNDWERAIEFVLKEEGGENGELVANDKGGYTRFGISSAANPDIDVPNLTKDGAKQLYRDRYWNPCHCDELPSPLAIAVFDCAVNQGVGGALRTLQIALGDDLVVDGKWGDKTAVVACKASQVALRRFLAQRMARYLRTILKDNTQEAFLDNWSNRLMRLAQLVFTPVVVA